ncbi:hypothetical protein HK096_003859 [Nowakowskiella sp. JEL0078]|nr:hypothetical protein HK096_003859 [Nowakowskiella sp. JEL0078]
MKSTFFVLATVVAISSAAVIPAEINSDLVSLDRRVGTNICGQWGSETDGQYTVYNNGWGWGSATSGTNCVKVTSYSSNKIAWKSTWSFTGGQYSIKSYPNARVSVNKKISAIGSLSSTWTWSYSGSNLVGDVSWDGWLASSTSGNPSYEIMVFLGSQGGWGPLGSKVATASVGGYSWNLHKGTIVGSSYTWTVYSFAAPSNVNSISIDFKKFLTYLTANQGVSSSLYFTTLGAGIEPVTGSNAVFTTSNYQITIA